MKTENVKQISQDEDSYIFLKAIYSEDGDCYYAIRESKIEKIDLSNTYGDYGQITSPEDAGDTITLLTQKACDVANESYNAFFSDEEDHENIEKYHIEDYVSAYESTLDFEAIGSSMELKEGEDYEYNRLQISGFTYWDGHNFKTIVTHPGDAGFEADFEIVDNDELVKELNEAIETCQYVKEGFGEKIYENDKYIVIDNYCEGRWESYAVIPKDQY
jgi:hypothetical protein